MKIIVGKTIGGTVKGLKIRLNKHKGKRKKENLICISHLVYIFIWGQKLLPSQTCIRLGFIVRLIKKRNA